ncbi:MULTISPECIES: hypothetical protein [unclassified Caulobacter]|uniref:hypothetical protein n=1 Tax=unclassified Caulobacter TaxID=2648921 RepID=UPI000783A9F3|nr:MULTISPECIES: hypothetical protein [unclassified Caulobacter]AZS20890.1 hypothetical protein CSW63_09665 [Caulobacter sp. FWC26]
MANALFLALALLAQDGQASPQSPNAPPSDEYGYVAWCYGALGGYASLYDQVMPEVTRIEKAFPGPDGVEASLKTYPELRAQARKDLKTFASAITAAEKASPRPISEYGGSQVKRGAAIWQGAGSIDKARLAQMWMSWSPPGDCEKRAKALEIKSSILGKALNYNAVSATTQAPATEAQAPANAPSAAEAAPPAETAPEPPPASPVKPAVKSVPAPAKPTVKAPAAKPTASTEVIVDPANPVPCAGSLVPAKRGGKDVLICKAD